MPRKSITAYAGHRGWRLIAVIFILQHSLTAQSAETNIAAQPKFLGANSCASSGCHGGAGGHQNQHLVWSTRDFHFQRPVATLTTARSKQIANALQIKDPTVDHQCISCHAPLREVPDNLRAEGIRISEGVSCETCHAPAENWLRSHTRTDYTHADRVHSGMRDLKNLYVRANTCVACHQNVSAPVLRAGHPELIFELDGQAVSEPKHLREKPGWHVSQAWEVGQAVDLLEALWQLESLEKPDTKLTARTSALAWLCEKIGTGADGFPKLGQGRANADKFAQDLAQLKWSAAHTDSILQTLANGSSEFKKTPTFPEQHARRAERLVLALDRLVDPQRHPKADAQFKNLFALAQSIPDFNAGKFAAALDDFATALKKP